MVSLLNEIRRLSVNGFSLWDAVAFLSLGRSPRDAVARALGARIFGSHSARWPAPAKAAITLERIVKSLSPMRALQGGGGGWMSTRPALLAYMVSIMGDARGDPESVFADAAAAVFWKLVTESTQDTAAALASLRHKERVLLRSIASGYVTFEKLRTAHAGTNRYLVKIIEHLAESEARGPTISLQPPYPALIQSWITPTGELAVVIQDGRLELPFEVRKNLIFLADNRSAIPHNLQNSIAEAVLCVLATNGIGIVGDGGRMRPPCNRNEYALVPALEALAESLSGGTAVSHLRGALEWRYHASSRDGGRSFRRVVGFQVLLGLRHFDCHALGPSDRLIWGGLSAAVVTECVQTACRMLTQHAQAPFVMSNTGCLEER